jgi:hypothetical protein
MTLKPRDCDGHRLLLHLCRVADAGQGTQPHPPTAGVRNWPRDEIAGEGTCEGAAFAMGIEQPRMRRSSGADAIDPVAPWSSTTQAGPFGVPDQRRSVKIDLRVAVQLSRPSELGRGRSRPSDEEQLSGAIGDWS